MTLARGARQLMECPQSGRKMLHFGVYWQQANPYDRLKGKTKP
jgi:hypothetical protein